MSLFETDTAVNALGDGHFSATVTSNWNGLAGRPLGGYVLAICLRAMQAPLNFPDLLVTSAFFLAPVAPGPVELKTKTVRMGGRTATTRARLCQHGSDALEAVATFGDLGSASGQNVVATQPPRLPDPADAVDLHDGAAPPTVSIADRVEYRVAQRSRPTVRRAGDELTTQLWMRMKEGGDLNPLSLAFMVDAAPPAVLAIGATGSTTIQLTLNVRHRPSTAWLACRATTHYITDGYHDEDLELWDRSGRIVAQSRQLARLPRADILTQIASPATPTSV